MRCSTIKVFASRSKTTRALEKINSPTKTHKDFQEKLQCPNTNLIITTGPSGTGKTYTATYEGVRQTVNKRYNKVVITRPTISTDCENTGFLPGNINKKMEPWLMPIYDTLYQTNTHNLDTIMEIAPISHIRGRTFHDSFIIADEMQNATPIQMKTLLTRIGENTKIVLTGDLEQSDIIGYNGLEKFVKLYKNFQGDTNDICQIEFTKKDIQRSKFCQKIVDIYENM